MSRTPSFRGAGLYLMCGYRRAGANGHGAPALADALPPRERSLEDFPT